MTFKCICKVCSVEKLRVARKRKNLRKFYYYDENGKVWNGLTCYECDKIAVRARVKLTRTKERPYEALGPKRPLLFVKKYGLCGRCREPLLQGRRFNCRKCVEFLSYRDIFEEYGCVG